MLRWLKGRGARAAEVAQMQARIAPDLWRQVLDAHPFLAALDAEETAQLLARSAWLLASKTINGAQGLEVTDFMRLSIAAQASLPILNLTPTLYEGWDEIIVYPAGFRIPRQQMDENGVMHEYLEDAAGEAWEGGPLVLSWADTQLSEGGFNVVIHEFAHKLDMLNGDANGFPPLHADMDRSEWSGAFGEAYEDFGNRVRSGAPLAIDPYAAETPAEFFAVLSEAFFEIPKKVRAEYPRVYGQLAAFYRQDPAARSDPGP